MRMSLLFAFNCKQMCLTDLVLSPLGYQAIFLLLKICFVPSTFYHRAQLWAGQVKVAVLIKEHATNPREYSP